MDFKKSFEPIVTNNSRILILGSLPSDKSINVHKYYGNKTNHFWHIISFVFENKKTNFKSYNEKIEFLNKHNIALWDVYSSAVRIGSLDTNIQSEKFNNIKDLLTNYKNIENVLLNGQKAEDAFKQYLKSKNIYCIYKYFPSSSSTNTQYTIEEKIQLWKKAILE